MNGHFYMRLYFSRDVQGVSLTRKPRVIEMLPVMGKCKLIDRLVARSNHKLESFRYRAKTSIFWLVMSPVDMTKKILS